MDYVADGSLLELELHTAQELTVRLGSYSYSNREVLLEPQRSPSRLHTTYQILLPQSFGNKTIKTAASERFVRIGDGFYLKNLFSQEYLSYDETVMRDPLLTRSVAPNKMFCFTKPQNFLFREDRPIAFGEELRLCSLNGDTFVRHKRVPGHSTSMNLALSKVHFDPVVLHRSSLESNHIEEGFPFNVFFVENGCYLEEISKDSRFELKADKSLPLIAGKFYLQRSGECFYVRSMFFNGYLDIREGRKPQLSAKKSEWGLFKLHRYSESEDEMNANEPDSTIYCLEHFKSGECFGSDGNVFGLSGPKLLPNALQLKRCVLDNIAMTGFMSTVVEVLNFDSEVQSSDFLKSFFIWTKGKLTKQMQLHSQHHAETSNFELLQGEFFGFDLVDKLLRIHTMREENGLKQQIIGLIGFVCKDNPANVTKFLRQQNFIVASFYEEHFDLSAIISLQQLMNLPQARLRQTLDECNRLLLVLAERGQADDNHPKFLQFLKCSLQLNHNFGTSLEPFSTLLKNSRRIQHFKLASRHEQLTLEDELILEIYIILAGKKLVPKLPLASLVTIAKEPEKELKLRKLCVQYLLVEYLQETYKQPDHVIFESVEEEHEVVMDHQLSNFVVSLKEYCLGELRVIKEYIHNGHIIAVVFLLYMMCLGGLKPHELMEVCANLISIIDELGIFQEHYQQDYDFLSHSVKLLSKALRHLNSLRLRTSFREMLRSPMSSLSILDHLMLECLDLKKLRLQNCVTKICYFVKLSGSNPKNSTLFLEAQDLLFEYTHNAQLYEEELLNTRVVKEFDVEALQAYALVGSIRQSLLVHKPIGEFQLLLERLERVVVQASGDATSLRKVQGVLRCMQIDVLLIGLVRSQILGIGIKELKICLSLLTLFARNNIVNCKSVLKLLKEHELEFSDENEQSALYRLVCVIVENPLIHETEYLGFIEKLLHNKRQTTQNSQEFLTLMVEITSPRRPVTTDRVIKYLIRNQQAMRIVLNIQDSKGKPVFLPGTTEQYLTLTFKLLNNLRELAHLNRDFRENLLAVLPAESYEHFGNGEKFFVTGTIESYRQTYLEVLLIQVLCSYGLLQMLPFAVAFNCVLTAIQSYTSCYRNLRSIHFEKVEEFFTRYPQLKCIELDAVVFAAKVLTPLLKQAEDLVAVHEKQLDEDRKQSLQRNCRILATEVIACYQGFLNNEDYLAHENTFNESLKILHRSFNLEPELKFYYNYNSHQAVVTKEDTPLCRNIFMYLERNEVEKYVFLYSRSDQLKEVLKKEFAERRKILGVILEDVGMGFVLETLLFCLQEATSNYVPSTVPMIIIKESKPSNMIRAALAIDKLLMVDKEQTLEILLKNNFAELLVNCLASRYEDIELLLVITLKMMKGEQGELNIDAQHAFQLAFLGKRRSIALRFIRRVLTDELNNMIQNQGARTRLERQIQMRLNNQKEQTNVYLKTVNTVECLCQSLNFDIKEAFGESQDRQKSILALLIELLERSLGVSINRQLTTKEPFSISVERCQFIEHTSKCVISLLHGPHRSNIKRALLLGYQNMCVDVMRIQDSLETLQTGIINPSSRVFDKGDLQHIKRTEPEFYESCLKSGVARRQNDFNYELIAKLKKIAITTLGLMFEQSVRYQKPTQTDLQGQLVEANIISLYEKLRAVYKVNDEQLIRLLYTKQAQLNLFERIIALRVFDQEEQKVAQLEDLKPSLSLQYGILMYNYLFWYYEWKGSKEIAAAVYKHANAKRLAKRYNKKLGVIYQLYCLVRDIFTILLMLLRLCCGSKSVTESFAKLEQSEKMSTTINFFAHNFQTIEIRMEDNITQSVCFPLVPQSRVFNKSIRRDLLRNIDYSSPLARLNSFMQHAQFTIVRLSLQYKLSRITERNRGLGVIVKYRELWKSISFMLGFLQNLVLLLEHMTDPYTYLQLMYALRSWQYAIAILLLIVFLFQSAKLRLVMASHYCQTRFITNPIKQAATKVGYLFTDKTFIYAFFYIAITIVGTYFPLMLSLLLLDFFYRFRSTRFLLELFNKPKWSLLNNIVLFIILLYIYSFIFVNNDDDVTESCATFLKCVQVELWLTLGLLGTNYFANKQFKLSTVNGFKTVLYLIFTILYRCLFLGIIINQKRKYRSEQQLRRDRVDNECFICGRSKETINKLYRSEKGFKKHVQLEHNLWNYVRYLVYVEKLKPESMTAQEQYVMALWKIKSLEWLPFVEVGVRRN